MRAAGNSAPLASIMPPIFSHGQSGTPTAACKRRRTGDPAVDRRWPDRRDHEAGEILDDIVNDE